VIGTRNTSDTGALDASPEGKTSESTDNVTEGNDGRVGNECDDGVGSDHGEVVAHIEEEIEAKQKMIEELKDKVKVLEENIEHAADAEDYALAATLDAEMADYQKHIRELEQELATLKK